jgi:hypothetical protein
MRRIASINAAIASADHRPQIWVGDDAYHRPWGRDGKRRSRGLVDDGTIHAGVFAVRGSLWVRRWIEAMAHDRMGGIENILAEQYEIDVSIFGPRTIPPSERRYIEEKAAEAAAAGRPPPVRQHLTMALDALDAPARAVLFPFHAFNAAPNSFMWEERWLHGDFIAHNAGDRWKEERLQAMLAWTRGEGGMFLPLWTYLH